MAFMGIENSSSSSIPSSSSIMSGWTYDYDVFLSFRGSDTRKKFTSHLYDALKRNGITTFRDDESLQRGEFIAPKLLRAIEESRFAVVIFSRDYASSRWCLTELAKIVECMDKRKLTVLTVFHDMDPSDVRKLRGAFEDAFAKHLKYNSGNVQLWRAAVTQVAAISGWDLQNEHESIVIQEILKRVFSELNSKFSSTISNDLVGIDSRVKEMIHLYLDEGSGPVRFLGICGMGGIGKTTLAQEIYKIISSSFEASCFIANVRQETRNQHLVYLQKQLLSRILMESEIKIWDFREGINVIGNRLRNKKVLIILDDVDGEEQLEALAGNHDWFGLGSKIIITSRDSRLLRRRGVNDIYTIKGLNYDDAVKLFSWKAFKKPHLEENYVDLSNDFVKYANGLPLALKVLGSLLFDKRIDEWKSALNKIKAEPNRKILDILQISFDGLEDTQKKLFLDIACFFKGENINCIRDILNSFGYYPDYNIGVLIDKSLITVDLSGILSMHDLLQEMGQEIVRRESPKEPGGRSRLCLYEDVFHVLKNNTGTEVVEGIVLNTPIQKEEHLNSKAFSKMKKLRLLKINNVKPPDGLLRGNVQLLQGLIHLSNELRVIEWHGYPLKSMPTSFQPNKLVELKMHSSCIKQLWKGIMNLDELKLIDLSDSQNLIEIPDLGGVPNLKQLILRHCTKLYKIHASLGNLKRLIQLDLNGCKCLESLPHKISLEALEIFDLGGCSRLKKFSEVVENMSRLSELCLSETTIKDLSLLVEHLTGLIKLDLRDCKNISCLPNAICSLMYLKTLTLSGCSRLEKLPEDFGNVEGLEELDVSGTAISELPSSVVLLKNLKVLSLRGCDCLSSKPSNKLFNIPLLQRRSPDPIGMLEHSLSGLCSLTKLDLSYCNLRAIPDIIGCLSSLKSLNLRGNNFVCLPKSIVRLSNLEYLYLSGCKDLQLLPSLPLNIRHIDADGCTSLETLPIRQEDDFRPQLYLLNCIKLIDNQGYGDMFLTMLRHYIQRPYSWEDTNAVLIPGSEIPKWFSHQSDGASLNLQGPSDFMGIAMCAVFVLHQHHQLHQPPLENFELYRSTHAIHFYYDVIGSKCSSNLGIGFSERFGKIDSYHLWLKYFPSKNFKGKWDEKLSQINVRIETEGPGLEVMKWAAQLVYEQDIEDLNQTIAGCSSCSITPNENDLENSAKDTKIKRIHDDFDGDGDGAGLSEEGISNELDIPHPKRIRLPNLIERFIPRLGNWIEKFNDTRTR